MVLPFKIHIVFKKDNTDVFDSTVMEYGVDITVSPLIDVSRIQINITLSILFIIYYLSFCSYSIT